MIKITNGQIYNFEGAFRGLRNPMNSWSKSDSNWETGEIGINDLNLAQRMINGGTDESKFMRQIMVSIDIEAPLFWWKEFDTYKVGTVANSCSTMHKLCSSPITQENFSFGEGDYSLNELDVDDYLFVKEAFENKINECEKLRQKYLKYIEKAKEETDPHLSKIWKNRANTIWRTLIEILPNGWIQKRTVTLNYQVLRAMYFSRKHHKLKEWRDFCFWIEQLPYGEELICYTKERK